MEKATCDNCRSEFKLNKQQQDFYNRAIDQGMPMIMLECANCGFGFPLQLTKQPETQISENYRCPVRRCSGWVSLVDTEEKPFWGCGECGSMWYDKANLFKEITEIVKLYPYRKKSYKKSKSTWIPNQARVATSV